MAKQKKKPIEGDENQIRWSVVQMPTLLGACVLRNYRGFDILLKPKPQRPTTVLPDEGLVNGVYRRDASMHVWIDCTWGSKVGVTVTEGYLRGFHKVLDVYEEVLMTKSDILKLFDPMIIRPTKYAGRDFIKNSAFGHTASVHATPYFNDDLDELVNASVALMNDSGLVYDIFELEPGTKKSDQIFLNLEIAKDGVSTSRNAPGVGRRMITVPCLETAQLLMGASLHNTAMRKPEPDRITYARPVDVSFEDFYTEVDGVLQPRVVICHF